LDNTKLKAKKPRIKKSYSNSNIFQKLMVDDVRSKILFTVLCLLVYRLGCGVTIPFVNTTALTAMFGSTSVLDYYNLVSGGALSQCAVFAIGVSAYINASIIIQLLTVAIPKLEEISKDIGGQKQINKITQYVGCGLAVITAVGYFFVMKNYGAMKYTSGISQVVEAITVIALLTAGSQIVIWLGWLIDEKGIGNGISLIIFTGIISRWDAIISLFKNSIAMAQDKGWWYYLMIPGAILFVLAATFYVVFASDAERRVPVQYAGKTIGSKSSAGQSSYIPLKLIMSGVMPIIFSSTICSLPSLITMFMDYNKHPKLYLALASWNSRNWVYDVVYIALIFAFNLFYIDITFDPIEMANNLRKNGGSIPGIRPGRTTSDYLRKACHSLAGSGAFVLSVIACVPILATAVTGLNMHFGGTSLLIVTGVALEVIDSLNSQLVVRHHKGFLY
jgi:preprotein translocase subunit SecY